MRLLNSRFSALPLGLSVCLMPLCVQAQVDVSGWPQVKMEVLAVDRDGLPVPAISADALQVYAGGKPQPVVDLTPAIDPQSVCVLIDASDSVGDGLSLVRAKVRRLLMKLPADDEVCVAAFSSTLAIVQPMTADRGADLAALDQVQPAGGTQLRDALLQLSAYMRTASRNKSRAIILFSDGVDRKSEISQVNLRRALEMAGNPVVHMVVLPEAFGHARRKQVDPHESAAFAITGLGGGLTYFPHTMGDLNGIVEGLPQAMRSRYVLTLVAKNSAKDGHEERVQVSFDRAHRSQGTEIRTPEGYYAPSQ
jgi:VWFA-related protein